MLFGSVAPVLPNGIFTLTKVAIQAVIILDQAAKLIPPKMVVLKTGVFAAG